MDIKYDVSITSIGNLAKTFLENNNSAIMLDEGIRPNLADMVIEHTPGELTEDIKKGDKLALRHAQTGISGGRKPLIFLIDIPNIIAHATHNLSSVVRGAIVYNNYFYFESRLALLKHTGYGLR